jgi:hypothetical protein
VKKHAKNDRQVVGLIGVGLDGEDGQTRITRNEDILVVGGSSGTHERLQDVSVRFNESLRDKGKRLADAKVEEVIELLRQAFND